MKKIELKNLRAGQMVEAKHNVIDSHGDLIYKEWNLHTFSKLENLPYYSVKTEDGYSNIVDDDYLNEHFRLPVLTEGKEYECVSSNDNCLTVGKKYKYLMYSGKLYQFECDMYPSEGNLSPHYFEASEVFTHFGIVVGEEEENPVEYSRSQLAMDKINELEGEDEIANKIIDAIKIWDDDYSPDCDINLAKNIINIFKQPPSDPPKPDEDIRDMVYAIETEAPKPEEKRFEFNCIELADYHSYAVCDKQTNKVVCHLLYENGADYCKEHGNKIADLLNSEQQLQSRIKELEGELVTLRRFRLEDAASALDEQNRLYSQIQALKANGQEEK